MNRRPVHGPGASGRRPGWRRALWAACLLASAGLLTGCGVRYDPGPRYTLRSFFLYVRLGSYESAWQDLAANLQVPGRTVTVAGPAGESVSNIGFPSFAAFKKASRRLRSHLVPIRRMSLKRTTATARVVAYGESGWHGQFSMVRVDNEWIITSIILTSPRGGTRRSG